MKQKPYFTKLMPVEGEIKSDDSFSFISPLRDVHIAGVVTDSQIVNKAGNITFTNKSVLTKVKLFLCSRDIKVGDKAATIHDPRMYWDVLADGDTVSTVTTYRGYWRVNLDYAVIGMDAQWIRKEDVFKIIGEISPEATWVKEGDEFDDKEVMFYVPSKFGFAAQFGYNLIKEFNLPPAEIFCKLEGPCGHFH